MAEPTNAELADIVDCAVGTMTCPRSNAEWDKVDIDKLRLAASRLREAEGDAGRLDYLDALNATANERARSNYGWRLDINHNRVALTDHNHPKRSAREAIDEHRAAYPVKAPAVRDADHG